MKRKKIAKFWYFHKIKIWLLLFEKSLKIWKRAGEFFKKINKIIIILIFQGYPCVSNSLPPICVNGRGLFKKQPLCPVKRWGHSSWSAWKMLCVRFPSLVMEKKDPEKKLSRYFFIHIHFSSTFSKRARWSQRKKFLGMCCIINSNHFFFMKWPITSSGSGNMMVEFFSAEMLVRVCK